MRHARVWMVMSLLGTALPAPTPAAPRLTTAADCEARIRRAPKEPDFYRCFTRLGNRNHEWSTAIEGLKSIVATFPDNSYARLTLAKLTARLLKEGAEDIYKQAIAGFQAQHDIQGLLQARLDLVTFLQIRLRLAEAEKQLALAEEGAARAGDPLLTAWVGIGRVWAAFHRDTYGKAEQILRASEDSVFSRGSPDLQSAWLSALGAALWGQGNNRESLETYQRQAELLHKMGDIYEEAGARRNVLLLRSRFILRAEMTDKQMEDQIRLEEEILRLASASGNRSVEAETHLSLAQALDSSPARREHLLKAMAIYGDNVSSSNYLFALRLLARDLAMFEPKDISRSFELLDQSMDRARRSGALFSVARTWIARASLQWDLARGSDPLPGMQEKAVVSSLDALEAIEGLRERQKDSLVKARTFSMWAFFYQRIAGQLFRSFQETADPEDLQLAFTVLERRRARVLLDDMDAGQATARLIPAVPLADQREQRLDEMADILIRLHEPGLSHEARETLLDQIQGLENEAAAIQAQLVRQDPVFRSLRSPDLASLRQVGENLADDEALLSFQTANGMDSMQSFDGGSRLLVQTRSSTRLYALPQEKEMKPRIQMFLGLIAQRDGSE
ncbi:MAG: hypothetical protein ACE5ID_08180, partial [Acidobacteriota bacterium]